MGALRDAIGLLASGDPEIYATIGRTLFISGTVAALAMVVGVPLGYVLSRYRFRGRMLLLGSVNTGMGLPPVVVGLVVWLLLTRSGPFGAFELIYTKTAMIVAQFLIALPLVVGIAAASFQAIPAELPELLQVLGASRARTIWLLSREARFGLLAAIMAGFGAAVSEVGAAMTVGGNLQGSTRVLTTAIVTTTSRGEISTALALGLILLVLAFGVNLVLTVFQQRRDA